MPRAKRRTKLCLLQEFANHLQLQVSSLVSQFLFSPLGTNLLYNSYWVWKLQYQTTVLKELFSFVKNVFLLY